MNSEGSLACHTNCRSVALRSWNVGIRDQRATVLRVHAKNLRLQRRFFVALHEWFISIFSPCQHKLWDILISLKYNKTNLKPPFKSQDGNTYLQLNLIDYILIPTWVPSKFPHTLNVFSWYVYLFFLFLFLIYVENFWHMNYRFTFLLLFYYDRIIRYLGRSNRGLY